MRRYYSPLMLVLIGLAGLQNPDFSRAADSPKFDSPAEVMSAAENTFGKADFKAFVDCFDAEGQKQMVESFIAEFTAMVSETPAGPEVKNIKSLFAKHGVSDLSKKAGESDDDFTKRLAAQLKDQHDFLVEATPLAFPNPKSKGPIKGELKDVKLNGSKAQATYVVKQSNSDAIMQDVNFAQAAGSWKIAKAIFFVSPEE